MGGVMADHQEVTVGQVVGVEFFSAIDPSKANAKALEAVTLMRTGIGATDGCPTKVLRDRRRALEGALLDIEACARIHAAAEEFYSRENFFQMLRWANDHGATQARYISEGGVVREEGRQGGITISPPPAIEIELLDLISDYRRSD
jgi:hypothetical protein